MRGAAFCAALVLVAAVGCERPRSTSTARTVSSTSTTAPAAAPKPVPGPEPTTSSEVLHQSAYAVFELRSAPTSTTAAADRLGETPRLVKGRELDVHHADWLDADVLPGSIAKLATLTEGLRRGAIEPSTRIACTRRVTLADGRRVDCTHPIIGEPLDVMNAIGHSCNVFAAAVAPRLTREQLSSGLVALGFAPLAPHDDPVAAALGLGQRRVQGLRLIDVLLRALEGPPAIRDGLALAADRGTAAAFGRAGLAAFAKTGTAPMPNGRSLGLTVAALPRDQPTHVAVVLLPGGRGADAAGVAAHLLRAATAPARPSLRLGRASKGGGYDVVRVDLEDYVAEVVSGETPADTPSAAREALAIAARTFALANRDRHRADGFDLCELTHCQVVRPADLGATAATLATRGRVLQANGQVTPVFYSAECGGMLDAASAIADAGHAMRGLPWTRARPDPAGGDEPEWRTEIEAPRLEALLHTAGFRGSSLHDLRVETNAEGRVRRVRLVGLAPDSVGIDDFRRLVAPDLGWNIVRSTRFTVQRTSNGYELRGRGHGHGVGLCVYGASRLARAGSNADAILSAYFPGLEVRAASGDPSPRPSPGKRGEGELTIRLQLPASADRERKALTGFIERAIESLAETTGGTPPATLEVIVHPTVESYTRTTRRRSWTSAAARIVDGGWRIDTIPLDALRRSGRLETTLRHELAHVLIDVRLDGRPLWVREGLALHFAGERLTALAGPCPTDAEFRAATTREAMAAAYRRAASCTTKALEAGVTWTELGRAPAAR